MPPISGDSYFPELVEPTYRQIPDPAKFAFSDAVNNTKNDERRGTHN